ncbi:MAG TPA: Fe-S cluster assembly protein SufD [Burkholderiales bacterium]|nr:Fe-S cluster assembly protein SufD [Burkholderiales bacterium]
MRVETRNSYLDSLLQSRDAVAEAGSDWLRALRMRAVERSNELSVPTTRDEDWRFTDLSALYKASFRLVAEPRALETAQIGTFAVPEAEIRLVFVDGHYSTEHSQLPRSGGVTIGNLADLPDALEALAKKHLASLATIDHDAFAAVNTAFLRDGAVIHVESGHDMKSPIHLLFVATSRDSVAYPRVLVVVDAGAQCTVVEDFIGEGEGGYLTDAVSEIFVAENARMSHVRLQRESSGAFHIGNTSVQVARGGSYSAWTVALGARISRHDLALVQAGEGTEFSVDGLALIGGRQLADTHSSIDHAHAHGRSRQLHKTVVAGGAHAVFNGKILVRKGAQQTDSGQQSRNLLLSDKARVDTKPQLEIFADDVKCAHGAAVGQIDANELFYLKSRGLSDRVARNLLTYAFAAEVVERIPVKSLAGRLEQAILEQTQTKEDA